MSSKPRKAFPLRIEPELYAELEAWAEQEMRSVNGQIEYLLRQAVQRHRRPAAEERSGPAAESASSGPRAG